MTIITSNQINIQGEDEYFYSVSPYEMTNALGSVVAILQEYTFTRMGEKGELNSYKLYKTKEGNWYEINSTVLYPDNTILRKLKTAIDMQENPVEI
ncbi:MAG: hypothetical protein ABI261_05580 [Ginsengibacter sp.]